MNADMIRSSSMKMLGLSTMDGIKSVMAGVSSFETDENGFIDVIAPMLCDRAPEESTAAYVVLPLVLMSKVSAQKIRLANIVSIAEPDEKITSLYMDYLAGNAENVAPNFQMELS